VEFKLHVGVTEVITMSIFQTLGLIWIILTSSLATVGLFYLAYMGLKAMVKKETELRTEAKDMFRIAGGR
jgi:threonine/homoserine/homoserine lactone efflux protein